MIAARLMMVALVLVGLTLNATAQGFEPSGQGFVWKQGQQIIRFEKGVWSMGLENGRMLRIYPFMWHDSYVYETLGGGTVTSGPELTADGAVVMTGTFSARNESAPLKYSLKMTAQADRVDVEIALEKTGTLKLTNGALWLHIFADKPAFTGEERIWAPPAAYGNLLSPVSSVAGALYIGLPDRLSAVVDLDGYGIVNRDSSANAHVFRMCVLSKDFGVGEQVTGRFSLGFAQLPDKYPGQVLPMSEPLAIRGVTASAAQIKQYDRLELTVDLGARYDNPYDPDDVALDATFTAPSGKTLKVPGFFMVEQTRIVRNGVEVMEPKGNGVWKVRFTPTETGRYTWTLALRDRTGQVSGGAGSVDVMAGDLKGFLRPSKVDPRKFAFDNGEGYFAIGHNLPTYHTTGQLAEEALRKMAAAGENYNRWWMHSGSLGIEWCDKLGWYRQDKAAQCDYAMDLGRELGMYFMMCMDTHQDYRSQNQWARNPFNAANGGPCATPADFFTNETAKTLYRKRLRYTVARWGYSPNVLCWEFGNEIQGWEGATDAQKLPWHREMSDYLRSIDPFGHMITTSFWGGTGVDDYWNLPNIDIVQTHEYTGTPANVADIVRDLSLRQWRTFTKPHIFGEFGINAGAGTEKQDPPGWGLHNALWAGLTAFCAGGPMPWWHENYIDPLNLYFHFTAIANFTRDLPIGTVPWDLLETDAPFYQDRTRKPDIGDAKINTFARWEKPEFNEFRILPDGTVDEGRRVQQLLQGQGHADLKNPPTFLVTYPQPGRFVVHVGTVSNSGLVKVWVDGVQVAQWDLPCGEGLGKSSTWRPQWNLWETVYEKDFSVDIPAGEHRIRIDNEGKDWVKVDSYTFTGCKVSDRPDLLVAGMKAGDVVVLWVQNRQSDWYNHSQGTVNTVDPSEITVRGLKDGAWKAQWWETWKGTVEREETVQVRGGAATLKLPALTTDVAVKLRPM